MNLTRQIVEGKDTIELKEPTKVIAQGSGSNWSAVIPAGTYSIRKINSKSISLTVKVNSMSVRIPN